MTEIIFKKFRFLPFCNSVDFHFNRMLWKYTQRCRRLGTLQAQRERKPPRQLTLWAVFHFKTPVLYFDPWRRGQRSKLPPGACEQVKKNVSLKPSFMLIRLVFIKEIVPVKTAGFIGHRVTRKAAECFLFFFKSLLYQPPPKKEIVFFIYAFILLGS